MTESYGDLLKLIEDIEKSAPKIEQTYIDIQPIMEAKVNEQQSKYKDFLSYLEKVEGRHIFGEEPAAVEKGLKQPVEPKDILQTMKEEGAIKEKNVAARRELGAITAGLPQVKEKAKELKIKRANPKDLVLPNLPIADQISELERIIEGIRENVFDNAHLDIVVQEVYGLSDSIEESRKQLKKRPQLSELEQSLWTVRDQRIAEAVSLIASRVNA